MIAPRQVIELLDAAKTELVTLRWLLMNAPDSNEVVAFNREITAIQLRIMQLIVDVSKSIPPVDEETQEYGR